MTARDRKKSSCSQERKHSRSRDRKHSRSRSRDRKYSCSPDRKHSCSRSRSRDRRISSSREHWRSWERGGRYRDHQTDMLLDSLTPEERDARTVFCMQLAARIRPRDLEEFFSAVGKVRLVRMISDRNSRRSKGIAYIEFVEASSVPLAIGLTGQRLLGVPIIVQASQAEKNRAAAAAAAAAAVAAANTMQKVTSGPRRLYVGSLHFNITKEMLRGIFEPFGRVENIQLMMDSENGCSKGYGFITFADAESAKKALEQLNGFELAGRPMKVGHVTERNEASTASCFLSDELELTGVDQGTTSSLQLAEGTGKQIPPAAQQALQMSGAIAIGALAAVSAAMNPALSLNVNPPVLNLPSQPLATHCFQLSNMFHPSSENTPGWELNIQHDVIEECTKHGGVVHIYVDKNSPEGNVYVKCLSILAAMTSVNALHGRFFRGRMITAAYVPLPTYHNLFPESVTATQLLAPPPRR
ncbi:RNA-binding protein 39 isoform X2 [Kryptolebias marmoratus]|uniref:RNA-binding protein 39 isoform X2 n=1 Tax=Kryptolebias marmoratus TaxID=37003 RepID=UPI0018ACA514|nr:RNA-binding protein 39 isoform X2 [Kryptolebias marmoratus]